MSKAKRILADGIVWIGALVLTTAIIMFLAMNEGVITSRVALGIFLILPLVLMVVGRIVIARKKPMENRQSKWIAVGGIAISAIVLLMSVLFSMIINFVQPIVLNTTTNLLMVVGAVLMLVGSLVEIIADRGRFATVVASSLLLTMVVGIVWVNTEGYKPFDEDIIESKVSVFENGEAGYSTFRIPSIVALDKDVINESKGGHLEHDVLLATAEGRKNSSHDTGSIDMVGKVSLDAGNTWGKLMKIYSYEDEVGKFGNPTPVLDERTGDLVFPYMTATRANGFNYNTFVAVCPISADGTITFPPTSEHVDISFEKGAEENGGSDGVRSYTLMVGPGKGIQLKRSQYAGRLIIPASGGGHSYVMYNDGDPLNKADWKQSEYAGEGNECEAVELLDGTLCMVVRDNVGCCANHFEQYQRLSYSHDGGVTWSEQTVNTKLRSPICMSSVDMLSNGTMLLSYPDSFYTRVNLTIGASRDGGKTFTTTSLYGGPAGYSCVAVDSSDNVFVLAEIGKVDYNEELILLRLDGSKLAK